MLPGPANDDAGSEPYLPKHGDTGELDLSALRAALAAEENRPAGFWAEVKDAVTIRSALLVIGVLGLGLGFILSYVGGLHDPDPRNLAFDLVAPASIQAPLTSGLDSLPGAPLSVRLIADAPTAKHRVATRVSTGALVVDSTGTQDTLYVASAAGPSLSSAVTGIIRQAEAARQRTVVVDDLVPVSAQDSGGLASFYLAVGWTVAGYLIASILGASAGTRPATPARAAIRLTALALCAAAAGPGGAWIAQSLLGALPGAFWPTAATGALLVFGAGALTTAMQVAFGVVGIGLAVLLFVILGNPSAGGAYARPLLPPFWRAIGAFLPPGAGTDSIRSVAYFGGADTARPLCILGGYAVVGLVATTVLTVVLAPARRPRSAARSA
jgi:hypothetical protein